MRIEKVTMVSGGNNHDGIQSGQKKTTTFFFLKSVENLWDQELYLFLQEPLARRETDDRQRSVRSTGDVAWSTEENGRRTRE